MCARRSSDDSEDHHNKKTLCNKILTPCRCLAHTISFPLGCLLFTVIYWLIFIPIFYYSLDAACPKTEYNQCTWDLDWKGMFWTLTSLAWIILISVAVCCWSCIASRKVDKEAEQRKIIDEKKEKDKLLGDQVTYNNLKHQNLTTLSLKDEKQSPVKDINGKKVDNIIQEEGIIEKETVTLPIRKSIVFNEDENTTVPLDDKVKNEDTQEGDKSKTEVVKTNKPDESMMEEIDKMFPRCSVRRKPDGKKRPDTLIIHSPKYPKQEQEPKRFSVQECPRTASPLTPREMFFSDLIQCAKRQTIERTDNFLDNERKHSSNNYVNSRKPEVKDYVLKSRSGTEASSPEYFIANVPKRSSCTTEAFIFVDGGQPQEALTICYIDQEDDVFKN